MNIEEKNISKAQELNIKGVYFIESGKYEEALKYFQRAIEEDKGYLESYYNKATIYLLTKDFDKALEIYNEILQIDIMQSEACYQKGNILFFIKQDVEEAVKIYNKAIYLGEKNENLFYNLAQSYQAMGNKEQAIKWINRAISINPDKVEFYNKKADMLTSYNKYEEAIENYNLALIREVNNEEANHFKAILMGQVGRYEEAIQVLDNAEDVIGDTILFKYDKALIYEKQGKFNEALEALEGCEKIDPNNMDVLKKKAELYSMVEEIEKALSVHDKIIDLDPKNMGSYFSKGNLFMVLENFKEAHNVFQYIVDNGEDDDSYKISAYYNRALTLKLNNDDNYKEAYEKAIREYTALAIYYPYDPSIYILKANSLRDISKNKEAEEVYEYALDLEPNRGEIYLMRAKNRVLLGDKEGAKKDIEALLKVNKNYIEIIQADKELSDCLSINHG